MINKQINKKEVGDMATIRLKHWGKPMYVEGRVKEIKNSYGRNEYLITNAKVKDDFWIRSFEK